MSDLAAQAEQAADTDPELRRLLDQLPETWAHLDPAGTGEETALIYARSAYAFGYTRGLEARLS